MTKKIELIEQENPTLRIVPIAPETKNAEKKKAFLELQLQMATSSINHEYARIELDDTESREKQEDLLAYMSDCRTKYFEARDTLERFDPYGLIEFEKDLMKQKQETMTEYNA